MAEDEVTIRVPEVDQLKTLYGTKSEDTAGLLLKSALGAFGRKAEAYFELMPAMAVEMEPRDAVEAAENHNKLAACNLIDLDEAKTVKTDTATEVLVLKALLADLLEERIILVKSYAFTREGLELNC